MKMSALRVLVPSIRIALPAVLLLPLIDASREYIRHVNIHTSNRDSNQKMSSRLLSDIRMHGLILWTSVGFLMPVGILAIRMANIEEFRNRLAALFWVHQILQILSVLLTTIAAVMSFKNFNNTFNNSHQRIGIVLYGLVWMQAIIGFARPKRGARGRGIWFLAHWTLGTAVSFLGVITIYTGLLAYNEKTSRSISIWTVAFTAEISIIIILYLLQDKWGYIQKQRVRPEDEALPSTEPVASEKEKQNIQ